MNKEDFRVQFSEKDWSLSVLVPQGFVDLRKYEPFRNKGFEFATKFEVFVVNPSKGRAIVRVLFRRQIIILKKILFYYTRKKIKKAKTELILSEIEKIDWTVKDLGQDYLVQKNGYEMIIKLVDVYGSDRFYDCINGVSPLRIFDDISPLYIVIMTKGDESLNFSINSTEELIKLQPVRLLAR